MLRFLFLALVHRRKQILANLIRCDTQGVLRISLICINALISVTVVAIIYSAEQTDHL